MGINTNNIMKDIKWDLCVQVGNCLSEALIFFSAFNQALCVDLKSVFDLG